MIRWKAWLLSALTLATLSACDLQRQANLEEGVSVEADVRKQFGEPTHIASNPDGSRTFEYARQPEGQTNYFIVMGADGKMASIRQVLKPSEFAKVAAGMDKDQVRKILGRPAKTTKFDLKPDEEHWDWRWLDGQSPKIFTATFDRDGKVIKSASVDDNAALSPGGK